MEGVTFGALVGKMLKTDYRIYKSPIQGLLHVKHHFLVVMKTPNKNTVFMKNPRGMASIDSRHLSCCPTPWGLVIM